MKILIIEDEEKFAQSLKRGLENEGYSCDYITGGREGQIRIETDYENYDLVILDVMLPDKSGIDICREIRAENIIIPILMLTARDATNDKVQGLDSGADEYLVKPFELEELLARIRLLFRRPKILLPLKLKIKDLLLDPATRKVVRGKKEIILTTKEFAILEYFMRNSNHVLNREQILSHVWDYSFDSFSNVVDVHIKNLRKKIDGEGDEKLFETVRGAGYRLKK